MRRRNRQLTVCVLKVEGLSTPGHLFVTATPLEQGSDKISVMQDDLVGGTDGRVQKIERKVANRPAFVRLQNIETMTEVLGTSGAKKGPSSQPCCNSVSVVSKYPRTRLKLHCSSKE